MGLPKYTCNNSYVQLWGYLSSAKTSKYVLSHFEVNGSVSSYQYVSNPQDIRAVVQYRPAVHVFAASDYAGARIAANATRAVTAPVWPTNYGYYSLDALTWSKYTFPASVPYSENNVRCSITYGNRFICTVPNLGIYYSTNGTSWTKSNASTAAWSDVAYGAAMYIAVADGTSTYAYSTNGTSWNTRTFPDTMRNPHIIYGNGMWFVIGQNLENADGKVHRGFGSTDGINWTTYESYNTSMVGNPTNSQPLASNGSTILMVTTTPNDSDHICVGQVNSPTYRNVSKYSYLRIPQGPGCIAYVDPYWVVSSDQYTGLYVYSDNVWRYVSYPNDVYKIDSMCKFQNYLVGISLYKIISIPCAELGQGQIQYQD
ncbi:hypothetical protein [uncultured Duncaniella sp.]|uniref:hypothetical protein n=1 Tax=uncultured Duncaniella sp. TaxID=2768039 RepID=UPI00261744CD|nr:hypothetical protein [uncultured Duncaniella sp.]